MWNSLKSFFAPSEIVQPDKVHAGDEPPNMVAFRFGKTVAPDEAFYASFSGDIEKMVAALNVKTNPIDRHFLLLSLVKESYKRRAEVEMGRICSTTSELHLREFPGLIESLKEQFGMLPRVPTFQYYATLLTERGDFEKAIFVCKAAIAYGLLDGTKSGFEGRIIKIQKAQANPKK